MAYRDGDFGLEEELRAVFARGKLPITSASRIVGCVRILHRVWDIRSRSASLDGIRGLAIILVLLFHTTIFFHPSSGFPWLFAKITSIGWVGVDLFFVLSGFLITRILLRTRKDRGYFKKFYMRRSLRIFPVFYLALATFLLILPLFVDMKKVDGFQWLWDNQLWYWTYLFNWPMGMAGIFPPFAYIHHFWSLAIEEQFYFIWPAFIKSFSLKTLFKICIALIVICFVVRIALPMPWQRAYTTTPFRIDSLIFGALLALVFTSQRAVREFSKWKVPSTVIALFTVVGLVIFQKDFLRADFTQKFGYTALAILFFNLIFHVNQYPLGRTSKLFASRVLRFYGKYSYALYVVHWPIIYYLYRDLGLYAYFIRKFGYFYGQLSSMALAILAATALAFLSWHLFESQILRLKSRFNYEATR